MNTTLRVLLADPAASVIEAKTGTWFISGRPHKQLEALIQEATSIKAVRDHLSDIADDASLVHIDGDIVHAYRTVVGTHRLYYLRGSDGSYVVADHFRNALTQLEVEDKTFRPRQSLTTCCSAPRSCLLRLSTEFAVSNRAYG